LLMLVQSVYQTHHPDYEPNQPIFALTP
jgi:hypothetical protein